MNERLARVCAPVAFAASFAACPVCTDQGRCVQCQSSADCRYPGPEHCDPSGACVHCLTDQHCPTGLWCGADGVCFGAQKGQRCSETVACDLGLTCVSTGADTVCLEACNLYTPECPAGELCLKLTLKNGPSLVFDEGAPLGVCYPPLQGLRGYHEACADNCQPNLECVPDSATASTCEAFCDPADPACAPSEKCHPYPGDWSGRCTGDSLTSTPAFFCFAPCQSDLDCAVDGRTGVCDGKFPVTTQYVSSSVTGCRPACSGPTDCAAFGATADQCRLTFDAQRGRSVQVCARAWGTAAACAADSACASGYCARTDGRGVVRQGVCSSPCSTTTECQRGACASTALFSNAGGVGVRAVTSICGGGACTRDADCSAPWSVCAVDVDPQSAMTNLVSACRAPTSGANFAGEGCSADSDCTSGACGEVAASGQKVCLSLCQVSGTDCPAAQRCVAAGVRLRRADGAFQSFDGCVP